jgi:RHH-type proline utilization regulon transcriptional repressor/proline dehydrogenase/delta 1-pyrroline-5-carboxylate dehydrogenase
MALHDPVRLSPISRQTLREDYRAEENACVAQRMEQAAPAEAKHAEAAALASKLIEGARRRKASGIDAFLHQ